jgi:hypothetical protein
VDKLLKKASSFLVDKKWVSRAILIITVVVILAYYVAAPIVINMRTDTYTVTVTDKLRVSYGRVFETHKYLIFTMDDAGHIHVFENTDSLLRHKFNSSDYFARIHVGKTYTFTVAGYRIPTMSRYENIIEIN